MGLMTPRHIALALLVVLIWGLNFVVIHEGLAGMPPLLFVAIRFACILPIMAFVPRPQVAWRDLALVGLLMSAGQFGFSVLGDGSGSGLRAGLADPAGSGAVHRRHRRGRPGGSGGDPSHSWAWASPWVGSSSWPSDARGRHRSSASCCVSRER